MLIAQADLGQLPPALFKDLILFGIALLVAVSFVVVAVFSGLQYFQSKRAESMTTRTELSPNPLKVDAEVRSAPKRFNKDFEDQRHGEIDRRLTQHDLELERLRVADQSIREDVAEKFESISHALGRIEGKLH